MTILLDESVPRAIKTRLYGHAVKTVQEMGWTGLKNGELLRRADEAFDVFLTADKKLRYQQNLAARKIYVIVLPTNRVPDALRLIPAIERSLQAIQPGTFLEIPEP